MKKAGIIPIMLEQLYKMKVLGIPGKSRKIHILLPLIILL
jgi:hypothetical protein